VFKNPGAKALFTKAQGRNGELDQSFLQKTSAILQSLMLRRTKQDVRQFINLKPKTEKRIFVPLTSTQKSLYLDAIKQNLGQESLEDFFKSSSEVLDAASHNARLHGKYSQLLLHLRKICTHPFLVTGQDPRNLAPDLAELLVTSSGKFIALDTIIREIVLKKNRKLVIFSSFTKSLDYCEALLKTISNDGEKFKTITIQGKQKRQRRNLNIRMFQDNESEYKVMLVSTKAGGEGITLTGAQDSVFIDEDWNPQSTLQAENRTHRIGQTGDVTVYKLCSQGTVEEQMLNRIAKKLYLSTKIMERVSTDHEKSLGEEGENVALELLQRMKSSELQKLIRIGTTALVHDEVDIESMLSWDLDTLIEKCEKKFDDDGRRDSQNWSEATDDEQTFLKSRDEIIAQMFEGQNVGGGKTKNKKRKHEEEIDTNLDRAKRRKGKETTIMQDGFAVKKSNLEPEVSSRPSSPMNQSEEAKKANGKAKVAARQHVSDSLSERLAVTNE
jgi:hypothetical protein